MIFNQRIWDIDNIFKTLLLIFMKYSISNGGTWCAYLVLIVCRGFLYLWISTDCMFKWLHCTVPKPENTNDAECHWNLNHCKDCRLLRYIVLGLPHNCLHFAAQFEHKLDSNSGHVIRVPLSVTTVSRPSYCTYMIYNVYTRQMYPFRIGFSLHLNCSLTELYRWNIWFTNNQSLSNRVVLHNKETLHGLWGKEKTFLFLINCCYENTTKNGLSKQWSPS